jgi:hypothetical protein
VKAELVKQEELKQEEETCLKVKFLLILYDMQRLFQKSKLLIVRFSGFSS